MSRVGDFFFGVWIMFMAGLIGIMIAIGIPSDEDKMIRECQKELPRNEHCQLIAVPEDGS